MTPAFDTPDAVAQGVLAGQIGIPAAVVFMTVQLVGLRARLIQAQPGTDFTAMAGEAVAIAQAVDAVPSEVWEAASIYDLARAASLVLEDIRDAAIADAAERRTLH